MQILSRGDDVHTLTKSFVGFITSRDAFIHRFFPNILIVRDPRDQMVSELMYRFYDFKIHDDPAGYAEARALLQEKVRHPSSRSTVDLFDRVSELVGRPGVELLKEKYRWVLEYQKEFQPHVLQYESYVEGDVAALEAFLGFRVPVDPEVDAEFKRVERTKGHGEWRAWFTEADLARVNAEVGELMGELGYALESHADLSDALPAATTLEWIEQFKP